MGKVAAATGYPNAPDRGKSERVLDDKVQKDFKETLCQTLECRERYDDLIDFTDNLQGYCERIPSSDFSGGESELLVLSRMYHQPITVYIPDPEAKRGAEPGYKELFNYGSEYTKSRKDRKAHKPVRLLYDKSSDHYDLLRVC